MSGYNRILNRIKNKGLFTLYDLCSLGLSQSTVSRLVASGELRRVSYGIYAHTETDLDYENLDFMIACKKFGEHSVVSGLSALYRYNLIEQVPQQVWVLVDYRKQTKDKLYRLIRTKDYKQAGIVNKKYYRITNVERTLLEILKMQGKVGSSIVINAFKNAVNTQTASIKSLMSMADRIDCKNTLVKFLNILSGVL